MAAEPTIHPQILEMVAAAQKRGIPNVMINTNGLRIANDDDFVAELAKLRPRNLLPVRRLRQGTNEVIRGADLLKTKLRALDRLAEIDLDVALVAAIERDVNEHEIGEIIRFGTAAPGGQRCGVSAGNPRRPSYRFRPDAPDDDPGRAARHRRPVGGRFRDERLRAGAHAASPPAR